MDDPIVRQFFLQPTQPGQRRYEAVRAVVIENERVADVAHRFGMAYGTLRNLVSQCRTLLRQGQTPPFWLST